MKKQLFSFVALAAVSFNAFAITSTERNIFSVNKSYNPENVMIIHSQTDHDCKFVTSPKNNEGNYLEFYWMMNSGRSKKEVHSLIRSEIKKRFQFLGINSTRDSFRIRMGDLNELSHDLTQPVIEVVSEMNQGECEVKAILTLGASARYKKIDLDKTYCEVSTNFLGVPNGCNFLELTGKDLDSGEITKVRFKKR